MGHGRLVATLAVMAGAGTTGRLSYSDKLILAPMVRAATLPMRLLALQYGADIVYSEELIDRKALQCSRIENPILNTVDFVLPDGRCFFQTCPEEKDRVVFQMGTADPEMALRTAKMVENDVAGIDVNMGCPKDYSVLGGMGAALLTDPDRVRAILTTLVQGVEKPVTCKIRLLPSLEDTLSLVKVIEETGVAALAIHGRYKKERPEQPCHCDLIKTVAQSVSIPVIANGGSLNISTYEDILAFKEATGCSSVMVARSALDNPSIFRKEGPLPILEVAKEYVSRGIQYDAHLATLKYCLSVMLKGFAKQDSRNPIAHASASVKHMRELSEVHKLLPYYESVLAEREKIAAELPLGKQRELNVGTFSPSISKRSKMDITQVGDGLYEMHVKYDCKRGSDFVRTPKAMLVDHASKMRLPSPKFTILEDKNRLFRSIVTLGKLQYTSTIWSPSKKGAEHSAALVALTHCGVLSQTQQPDI